MASPFLNVIDFGAKGDGIADDTAAIQAAVDQASVAGNVVILPAGNFRTSGPIVVKGHGVTLQGAGTRATILLPNGSFSAVEGAASPHPLYNANFADFLIDFTAPIAGVAGIEMSNFSASTARHLQIDLANGKGCTGFLFRADTTGNSPYYNMIVHCSVSGGLKGTGSSGYWFAARTAFTQDDPPRKKLYGNSNANLIIGGHATLVDFGVWFEVGYSNIADGLVTESIYEAHYAFGGSEPSLDSRGNRVLAGYAEGLNTSHLTRFVGGAGVDDNVVYTATYSGLQGGSLTTPGLIDPQLTIRNNVVVHGSTTSGNLALYANRHYGLTLDHLCKSDRVVTFDDLSGFVALRRRPGRQQGLGRCSTAGRFQSAPFQAAGFRRHRELNAGLEHGCRAPVRSGVGVIRRPGMTPGVETLRLTSIQSYFLHVLRLRQLGRDRLAVRRRHVHGHRLNLGPAGPQPLAERLQGGGTGGQSQFARLLHWDYSTLWRRLKGLSGITHSE